MYNPTTSRTFSTRSGSGDTLKLSWRHGLRPNARQISETVVLEIPCLAASPRVDQWVSAPGVDSNVSTTTASMVASAIVRSAPGRGASHSPSRRSASPFRHRGRVHPLAGGHLLVGVAISASQHDPRPLRQRLGRQVPSNPALQGLPFGVAQLDARRRSSWLAMVSLQCWLTSEERASITKIPHPARFRGKSAGRDTRSSAICCTCGRGVRLLVRKGSCR
jgi:hypothetical protein